MKKFFFLHLFIILFIAFSYILNASPQNSKSTDTKSSISPFSVNEYLGHLEFLSSDLLEGRATGTRGSLLTEAYIASQFKALGLHPIDNQQGYFQKITFDGFDTLENTVKVSLRTQNEILGINCPEEVGLLSELPQQGSISISGDLIFAGYFIKAPEYDWDDLKNTDFKDKIVVVLVNDPDFQRTGFGSQSMTYYGRWMYKLEMARRQKVKGIFLIHHDREATYDWHVVETINSSEALTFKEKNPNPLTFKGWISHKTITRMLQGSGLSYEKLIELAEKRSFMPFSLKTTADIFFKQKYRTVESANVIGIIPGNDQSLNKEAVIYTGHFDHLGEGKADESGDRIYNGALDNASGTAALLCLARVFSQNPIPPKRTIIFMAVTAEELGLLGSKYYVSQPILPLSDTVVVINKDCMNHFGKHSGFSAFPVEYSTALEDVKQIGEILGLKLIKRTKDVGGGAFRSDHFPFASRGVPALSVSLRGENTSISKEEQDKIKKEIGPTYHRPNDEIHPLWRYDGVIQELNLLYQLGRHWARGAPRPRFNMSSDNPYLATKRWYESEQ